MHFLWSMAPETPRNLCLQHLLFPDPSIPRSQAKRKYLLWSRRNLEGIGVQLMDSVGLAYCRSCDCAKGICGQVLMDTLGRHSMVNTQWTLHQHLGWHSVDSQLINCQLCIWVKTQMTLNPLLINWVSIGMSIEYWLRCRSRVSITYIDWHLTVDTFSTHHLKLH